MIVDSSALLAIIFQEKGYQLQLDKLAATTAAAMGTPTIAETGLVMTARLGFNATALLGRVLQEFEIRAIPFEEAHWRRAIEAYERFGKGRHPASLNFGDCLSYAVASLSDQPLLCRGADFAKTDLVLA